MGCKTKKSEMEMIEYFLILIAFLACAIVIKLKYKIRVYKSTRHAVMVTLLYLLLGVAWDYFAIYRGHWAFPEGGTLGIYLGLMPIEEYLFLLIIPFWALIMYKVIKGKN